MAVRWSSIAPQTAFSISSSSRSNLGRLGRSQAMEERGCGVRARGGQRLGDAADARGQQRRQRRHALGRVVGAGEGEVEGGRGDGPGGDGVGVGQHDDAGAPLRHEHQPRPEAGVGAAVAHGPVPEVAAHGPAEAPSTRPTAGHPPRSRAATSGRAAPESSSVGSRWASHPAAQLDQVGVQARAGGVPPGVGIGALGHRQRHPDVRLRRPGAPARRHAGTCCRASRAGPAGARASRPRTSCQ